MSDVYNTIKHARNHFHEQDVYYFRQVLDIANSLASTEEDRGRIASERTRFETDRNCRGVNFGAFYTLADIAMRLCEEQLAVDTPCLDDDSTPPPSPM
jgi:hypothetical protein